MIPSPILNLYAAKYPLKMDPLHQVSIQVNNSKGSINLSWTNCLYDGGLPILGYYLQINSGYGTDFLPNLIQVAATKNSY